MIAEGVETERERIALNLLKAGVEIATICQVTGLTEGEIRALLSKK